MLRVLPRKRVSPPPPLYRITEAGRRRIENGGGTGADTDTTEFAAWMVAWVAFRTASGLVTADDLRKHADDIFTYPDQKETTLAAATRLKNHTQYILMQASQKGWMEKV